MSRCYAKKVECPDDNIPCSSCPIKVKEVVYLANPYGFSKQQREILLPIIKAKIESLGYEVWEPFERAGLADSSGPYSAYEIGQVDRCNVIECDIFFAIINGNPPDEGVMIEMGMAIALGKPIYLFRDDFRKSPDSNYPLNLMIFCGLPRNGWEKYYFTSVEEISF